MVNVNDVCIVFYIFLLRTMIESTWKILKLDWKTHRVFSSKRVGTLLLWFLYFCLWSVSTDFGVKNVVLDSVSVVLNSPSLDGKVTNCKPVR